MQVAARAGDPRVLWGTQHRALVALMNTLYANDWSAYQNHFCPTFKLLEKQRINSKYRKRYEAPNTPYRRLLESEHISAPAKDALRQAHAVPARALMVDLS